MTKTQTIILSSLTFLTWQICLANPFGTFAVLYVLWGYATYKLINHYEGGFDYSDIESVLLLLAIFAIPWIFFFIIVCYNGDEIKKDLKNKYPNFKIPKVRNPFYFE